MTVPTDVHQTVTGLEPAVPVEFDTTTDLQPPQAAATDTTGDAMDERMEPANEVEATDGTHHAEVAEDPALLVRRFSWTRILAYGVLPGLALVLALGAGYLKWQDGSAPLSQSAAVNPVQAATESTIALLSYRPDTADRDLHAAGDRLTGTFRGDYTKLIQPRRHSRRQAEEDLGGSHGARCRADVGNPGSRSGPGVGQPNHHHRGRPADQHRLQRARHSRQGPRQMAHFAIRPRVIRAAGAPVLASGAIWCRQLRRLRAPARMRPHIY